MPTPKSFDWRGLLKSHSIFSRLSETEVARMLKDEVSQERTCARDVLIVKAGETGDSLFLIGAGSVQVTVSGNPIAVLGQGDFFGEIAVLEGRMRSASVTAREPCTVLEIAGETCRQLFTAHPEIEARVRATASMRLSQSRQ